MATTPKYDNDYVTLGYLNKTLGAESEETKTEINKIPKNYNSPPVPPYYENSLLLLNGQIYKCIKSRLVGSFNISDWKIVVSTNELDEALRFIYDVNKLEYVDQEDGVIETFYQEEDPSLNWKTDIEKNKHVSDLWTIDNSICYQYEKKATNPVTYGWKRVSIPTSLFDIVDGYRKIFTEEPTNYSKDDLWLGEITKIAIESSETFDSSHWEDRDDFIESSITEQEEYHKVYLLPKITEINRQTQSEIRKAVDEIVLRVSQTYTTKTEVEQYIDDVKTGVAEEYTTKEEFNAQLSLTSTQINAIVEKNTQQDGNIETLNQEYASLKITSDGIKTQVSSIESEIESTNENVNSLQTEIQGVNANFNEFKDNEYINSINNLQDQIDGAIQFWNGPEIPTIENYPANEWITENEKINHQADIYTVIQDVEGEMKQGKSYRFDKINGVWQWIELTDNELSAVQAIAQDALNKSNQNTTDIQSLNKKTSELEQTDSEIKASVTTLNNKYEKDITLTKQANGNPITIEDAGAYPCENFIVEGKSEQETRSGKNVAKISTYQQTEKYTYDKFEYNNISVTKTATGGVFFGAYSIDIKQTGTYTFSGNANFSGNRVSFFAYSDKLWGTSIGNYNLTKTGEFEFNLTFNSTGTFLIGLYGDEDIGTTYQVQDFMCRLSTITDKTYEPYGVSPSPDYPSEIETVKGIENLFDLEEYPFVSKVAYDGSGNKVNWTGYCGIDKYFPVEENETYTFSSSMNKGIYYGLVFYDENKNILSNITQSTRTFTTPANCMYIRFATANDTLPTWVQIEKGDIAHPFVPYGRYLYNKITGKNLFGYGFTAKDVTSTYRSNTAQRLTLSSTDSANKVKFNYKSGSYCNGYIAIDGIDGTLDYSLSYDIIENTTSYKPTMSIDKNNSDKDKLIILISGGNGTAIGNSSDYFIIDNIQIGKGSTEYEPYKENIITYDLKKENLFDISSWITKGNNSNYYSYSNGILSINKLDDRGLSKFTEDEKIYLPNGTYYLDNEELPNGVRIYNDGTDYPIIKAGSFKVTLGYIYLKFVSSTVVTCQPKIYGGSSKGNYYELASIGDIKDELDEVSGVLTKKIGKYTFNGTEAWLKSGSTTSTMFAGALDFSKLFQTKKTTMLNSHFKYTQNLTINGFKLYNYMANGLIQHIAFGMDITKIPDLETFKAWLSENPVTVYYVLEEPETIQLEPTEIELFKGTNNIYTLDDLEPNMNITYLTDSKMNVQYATKSELKVAEGRIESGINATLKEYSKTTEMKNIISQEVSASTNQILLEVENKIDEEVTGASILLKINEDTSSATINADKINLNGVVTANNTFKINTDGSMEATGGKIGGWSITENDLYNSNSGISSNLGKYAFWAGETNSANGTIDTDAKFRVGHDGSIHATAGRIGGWNITTGYLDYTFENGDRVMLANGSNEYKDVLVCYVGGQVPFYLHSDGYLYATNGYIAGNMVSSGINAGNITAGTLNIHNGSTYYLKMGFGTSHPEVSGLNVTGSGGINMNNHSIGACYDIGTQYISASGSDGIVKCNTIFRAENLWYKDDSGTYRDVVGLYRWFLNGKSDYIDVRDADGSTKLRLHFSNGLYTGYTKL